MSVKSNFPIFSVLTRTLKKSIKFVRLSSFNKNLNRSNPFNILGLMNVRELFLAHLVKFNGLEDVFNFVGTVVFSLFLIFEAL